MRCALFLLLLAPGVRAQELQPKEVAVAQPYFSIARSTFVVLREGEQQVFGIELKVALTERRAIVTAGGAPQGVKPKGAAIRLPAREGGVRSLRIQRVVLPPQWCEEPATGMVARWIVYPDLVSRITVGKRLVTCFDLNGDGRYWVAGEDGVVHSDSRYVIPLMATLISGRERIAWTRTDRGSVKVDARERLRGIDGAKDEVAAAVFWNEYRAGAGLPPVWLDEKLSQDCFRACEYLGANGPGDDIHTQVPGKRFSSEEGAQAARFSCIGAYPGALAHVGSCLAQLYHKRPLLYPETERVGIASRLGYVLADGIRGKGGGDRAYWKRPLAFPAHGQTTRVLRYNGSERPSPLPGMGKSSGASILLVFQDFHQKVESADAELSVKKGRGWAREQFWFSAPHRPANAERPNNDGCIALFPRENLSPRKSYRVVVRYKLVGAEQQHHEWIFHTRK
ncbi:MAG: spore germination YkwD domain-containing protein [Planctomycetota bacterium]|jgi:hypothetical protein